MKNKRFYKSIVQLAGLSCLLLFLGSCESGTKKYTRGVGVYPGNPDEDFSPTLIVDNENYRNIAKFRAAYHSSSYDYNLTAQLITDGIIDKDLPNHISLTTSKGELPKNEKEWLLDENTSTDVTIPGSNAWLQIQLGKNPNLPGISRITLTGNIQYAENKPGGWQFTCHGSDDSIKWVELGKVRGSGLPGQERSNPFGRIGGQNRPAGNNPANRPSTNPMGNPNRPATDTTRRPAMNSNMRMPRLQRMINQSFDFKEPVNYHFYKVTMAAPCAENWVINGFSFFDKDTTNLKMVPSYTFKSAWMSAGRGEEWVYVDLGSASTFDHVKLYWINKPAAGEVQVSEDAKTWTKLVAIPETNDLVDDIALNSESKGRFVRVLMTKSSSTKYILSEMEVMGKGGLVPKQKESPIMLDNRMTLSGGNWKIQRSSLVESNGENISKTEFDNKDWIIATVPGTALVSYWNIGALPDPNFGDNQQMISESFFNSDFWYRNEFDIPESFKGERMFLNFDGINWKADVYVNGEEAGRIEGAFIRGRFDVTDLIHPGQKNAVAVLIHRNDNAGIIQEQTALSADKNGGVLGADNPTFHAAVGWDWIPTIRGRDIGIWNDVFLSTSGAVTIENPFVTTDLPLPDTTAADISIELKLQNHKTDPVSGTLSGKYGGISFDEKVSLGASETKSVKLNPITHASLHFKNPKLWWPKGYGKQNLYKVELVFKTDKGISDKKEFKSGVREMAYDETNQVLTILINGRRLIERGGNWGFSESNLEYRGREYDVAVGYHADMNFTMIRNWVGQTGDAEFFEACDKYGIMVWQDFWLANPVDGPNPYNPNMFNDNAEDVILRIRNHPSMAIYVGRNEGNPPPVIDTVLRSLVRDIHPGSHYISNSAMGVVSGGGPYRALPVRDYFTLRGGNKIHSERGMPNVMTYESMKQMLPESALWPHNSQWGLHDFCLESAMASASFMQMVEKGFGPSDNVKKFTELAQWVNYNGYRGMFEGRSQFRKGLLLWMSHPAWPSMVWQTYDYYFDPTAAYFACKKACEPIHIQWNPVNDSIEVVNYNGWDKTGINANAQILNMDGSVQWEKDTIIDSKEDSTVKCFKLEFSGTLSPTHFIKLVLTKGNKILSENFYWRGLEDGNYKALNDLPKVDLSHNTGLRKSGNKWIVTTKLNNKSGQPVLMVRLKVVGEKSGERILPVLYSDNFISLMPGEKKVITMTLKDEDTRGERPSIVLTGFNIKE